MTKAKASTQASENSDTIKSAIDQGLSLIGEGKPKIEAAMAIFLALEGEPQETVVRAFVDGATLTEKGALTYWYNCRRKVKKQRLLQQADHVQN